MALLPAGAKQSDFARDTIKVLKKHRIPPSYGFINANKLERNPDGAQALQIWVDGGHPLANHTYTHLDLTKNSAEDFQREILRNEPALELLMLPSRKPWAANTTGAGSVTRTCTRATRSRSAARCAPSSPTSGYRIAQTTLDFEDYLWNSAHARCWMKKDDAVHRMAARELSHRRARVHALSDRRTHAPSSAATSTT